MCCSHRRAANPEAPDGPQALALQLGSEAEVALEFVGEGPELLLLSPGQSGALEAVSDTF